VLPIITIFAALGCGGLGFVASGMGTSSGTWSLCWSSSSPSSSHHRHDHPPLNSISFILPSPPRLEHSIANMFIIPFGIVSGAKLSFVGFLLKNLLPVTIGNIIGGAVLVAGINYAAFGSLFGFDKPPAPAPAIK
jgi:hypothetical protein